MKKIFVSILIGVFILCSGCGSNSETKSANEIETVEEKDAVVEPTVEPTKAPTPEPTIEPTPEPTEEPVEEFTAEKGFEKVLKLFDARQELLDKGSTDVEHSFLYAIEALTYGFNNTNNVLTADGISLDNNENEIYFLRHAIVANYFYDYVNKDSGYYNFTDYAASHTKDEIMSIHANKNTEGLDTDTICMKEAPGVLEYLLNNIETLSYEEMIIGEECTAQPVSDVKVFYEIPLKINGERCGVTAVFDEESNLLNLITIDEDGWSDDNYGDCIEELGLTLTE